MSLSPSSTYMFLLPFKLKLELGPFCSGFTFPSQHAAPNKTLPQYSYHPHRKIIYLILYSRTIKSKLSRGLAFKLTFLILNSFHVCVCVCVLRVYVCFSFFFFFLIFREPLLFGSSSLTFRYKLPGTELIFFYSAFNSNFFEIRESEEACIYKLILQALKRVYLQAYPRILKHIHSLEIIKFEISRQASKRKRTMEQRSTESSHSSRCLKAPKDVSRRLSLLKSESRGTDPLSTSSGNSERDLHWQRILGHPPHASNAVYSVSPSLPILPRVSESKRSAPGPLRSPQSRAANLPSASKGIQLHTQLELEQSSRASRTQPPKPFACDLCFRKFERKGHLKVGFPLKIFNQTNCILKCFDLLNQMDWLLF